LRILVVTTDFDAKREVVDFATDWDHTDPAWVADPYPIWEDLRERCPVAHTDRYAGGWFPTTHEMVSSVANDTEHFTSRSVVVSHNKFPPNAVAPIGGAPPITSDPPFHQIARRLILPAFAPGPINAMEPQVRALCTKHLDSLEGRVEIDAGGLRPIHLAGSHRHHAGFSRRGRGSLSRLRPPGVGPGRSLTEVRGPMFMPMAEYFDAQMHDHMENPRDDFTSYLLNVEIGGEKLAPEHVRGTMVLTLVAGIDTTWSAIGSAIWHLAHHPEDLARLVNEPDLMPVAVEEFLRFYAPVTMARLVLRRHRLLRLSHEEGRLGAARLSGGEPRPRGL
jgi:cytochrome P450